MTSTGDLETCFITPHASVILPGLPQPLTRRVKGPDSRVSKSMPVGTAGTPAGLCTNRSGTSRHPAGPMPPKRRSIQWRPETHGDKSAKPRPPATPSLKLSPCHPPPCHLIELQRDARAHHQGRARRKRHPCGALEPAQRRSHRRSDRRRARPCAGPRRSLIAGGTRTA